MVREMQRKLSLKAEKAKNHVFNDLYSLICQGDWLEAAWEKVRANKGSRTAGVDRVTKQNFERDKEGVMSRLKEKLKQVVYEPLPVRRVHIREVKLSGRIKRRPLGIPMACAYCISSPSRVGMIIVEAVRQSQANRV
jgi:RNA-directed DNA polymerase